MSNNKSLADKVREYVASLEGVEILGMRELSPRVVVVRDSMNETDVYFDTFSYKVIFEEIWKETDGRSCLFPLQLEEIGLGLLPGIGRAPPINSYDQALAFAKDQLEPTCKEAQFYNKPHKIATLLNKNFNEEFFYEVQLESIEQEHPSLSNYLEHLILDRIGVDFVTNCSRYKVRGMDYLNKI